GVAGAQAGEADMQSLQSHGYGGSVDHRAGACGQVIQQLPLLQVESWLGCKVEEIEAAWVDSPHTGSRNSDDSADSGRRENDIAGARQGDDALGGGQGNRINLPGCRGGKSCVITG